MLILLFLSVFSFRQWKKVLELLLVLICSYFLALLFATFTELKFNNQNIKFLIFVVILFAAITKIFDFKNQYFKIKKEYVILILTGLFGFLNGLGTSADFIPEIGIFDYKIIPVFEVLFGFSISVLTIAFVIVSSNFILLKFTKVNTLKLNAVFSMIVACITMYMMILQVLF